MTRFERLFYFMIRPQAVLLSIAVILFSFFYLDPLIATYFYMNDPELSFPILSSITRLGESYAYLGGFLLLALVFRYVRPDPQKEAHAWFLWLCVVAPGLVCVLLKTILGRARPILFAQEHLYGFFGPSLSASYLSFPSGHATTIIGVSLGLCALFPRYRYAFIFTGLIIAFSRILLNQHYLSDVLAGSYLALLGVGVLFCHYLPNAARSLEARTK